MRSVGKNLPKRTRQICVGIDRGKAQPASIRRPAGNKKRSCRHVHKPPMFAPVSRKKNCYLATQFRRLASRRGVKRAVMAVAHMMLIIAYHLLKTGRTYQELGGTYLEEVNKERLQRYFLRRLQRLGLK